MACLTDTIPRPGDTRVVLLRKLAQALGQPVGCYENEWTLVAKILTAFGGTPRPGDSISLLWEKLRRTLSDECECGNFDWSSVQQFLAQFSPGAFHVGDSLYDLIWALLEAVNGGVVPPVPPVPPVVDCCLLLESGGELLLESVGCLQLESCP